MQDTIHAFGEKLSGHVLQFWRALAGNWYQITLRWCAVSAVLENDEIFRRAFIFLNLNFGLTLIFMET